MRGPGLMLLVFLLGEAGFAETNRVDEALLDKLIISVPKKPERGPSPPPDAGGPSILRLNTNEFSQALTELNPDPIQFKVDTSSEIIQTALRRGRAHLVGQQYHQAIRQFYTAASIEPDNGEALSGLAVGFSLLGDVDRAVRIYERLIRLFPSNRQFRSNFASIKMLHEDYEGAIAVKPDFGDAHNRMGIRYAQSGQQQRALLAYELAIRHRPGYAGTYSNYGLALMDVGRHAEAARAFVIGLELDRRLDIAMPRLLIAINKQLPRGDWVLDKPAEDEEDTAAHYYTAARKYVGSNEFERALAHYIHAIFLRPDRAELFNDVGVLLGRMERHEEAIPLFRRALLLDPVFPKAQGNLESARARVLEKQHVLFRQGLAWLLSEDLYLLSEQHGLGLVCMTQGLRGKGIEHLTEAVLTDPQNAPLKLALARALAHSGEARAAINHAKEALTLLPDQPQPYYSALAFLYELTGELEEAYATHQRALELAPEDPALLVNIGNLLGANGDFERARRFYDRAIAQSPKDADLFVKRGWTLRESRQWDEAFTAYGKALDLQADHSEARVGHGLIHLERKRYDAAERAFRDVLRDHPDHAEAHGGLGRTLIASGKPGEGLAALSDALILMPAFRDALQAMLTQLPRWSDPNRKPLPMPAKADAVVAARHFESGRKAIDEARYPDAVTELAGAALHGPGEAEYFAELSRALNAADRPEAAVAMLQQALIRQPARPDYRKELTRLLAGAAQRRSPVMTRLQEQLKQAPDDPKSHFQAANLYLVMNNVKQALRHYIEAVRLDGAKAEYHAALIRALVLDGREDQAIGHTVKACSARSGDPAFLNRTLWSVLSRTNAEPQQLNPLLEIARRSFATREQPDELRTLAVAYAQTGRGDEARKVAHKAIELARARQDEALARAIEADLVRYRR